MLFKPEFEGLGWRVKIQHKRGHYFLTIMKELILGNFLREGDYVHYYLTKLKGRRVLVIALDKEPLEEAMIDR